MAPKRIFVLQHDGQQINELTVMFRKQLRTFVFPYETADPKEIKFLLRRGANEKHTMPTRQSSPTVAKSVVSPRGGE